MTNVDKILGKLRKLMNLQESAESLGNEGEAHAAASAISRLLLEYNLSINDIPEEEKLNNPVVSEDVPVKRTIPGPWFGNLIECCCNYNFCRALVVNAYDFRTKRYKRDYFQIVGRKKNVEVVLYLVSFLENALTVIGRRKWPEYRNKMIRAGIAPKTEPMYLRSFLAGTVYGLRDQFASQQDSVQVDIKAIVKSSDADIDAFLSGQKIGKARASKSEMDVMIARSGYQAGREIEIHKGIYANSVSEDLRLEHK